jgi:hypothetical protein
MLLRLIIYKNEPEDIMSITQGRRGFHVRNRVLSTNKPHCVRADIVFANLACLHWRRGGVRYEHKRLREHTRLPVLCLRLGIGWIAGRAFPVLNGS